MRLLARVFHADVDVDEDVREIHDKLESSDQRLDEARKLNKDALRRLQIVEARLGVLRRSPQ